MNTALLFVFIGAAVFGVANAAVLIAKGMRGLFDRRHHA